MRLNRLFVLFASLCWFCCCGALYAFPLWLIAFSFLTLQQQNGLSSCIYVSQLFGVFVALLKPKVNLAVVLFGCVLLQSVGFVMLWLVVYVTVPHAVVLMVFSHLFIGLAAGALFVTLLSTILEREKENALYLGSLFTLAFGVGGSVSCFFFLYVELWTFFLVMWTVSFCVGMFATAVVSCMLLSVHFREEADEEKRLLSVNSNDGNVEDNWKSLLHRFFTHLDSYLVIAIAILKVGVGAAFTSNVVNLVIESNKADVDQFFPLKFVYPLFTVGQTVGRLLISAVSVKRDLTIQSMLVISVFYIIILGLLSVPSIVSNAVASRILPLLFSIFYGAMWSTQSSIVFFSGLKDRRHFIYSACLVYPVSGLIGPFLQNYVVSVLHEDCNCYLFATAFLCAVSFVILILLIILAARQKLQQENMTSSI